MPASSLVRCHNGREYYSCSELYRICFTGRTNYSVRKPLLYIVTVLPALATTGVSGHLPCTATLSMFRHISLLNYLRLADTCLTQTRRAIYWLSVPAITDSTNKCSLFGGHFNPTSLAACTLRPSVHSNCHAAIWWPQALFHIEGKFRRDEPRDRDVRPLGYIRFTTPRRKSHVFCVRPAMMKKRTILSFEQCASCRALAVEVVRQNENSTYRSKQSGHRGRVEFGQTVERQKSNYVEYNLQVFAYCTIHQRLYNYDALLLG